MADYTPHTWVEGDDITAVRLNNIETGVDTAHDEAHAAQATANAAQTGLTDHVNATNAHMATPSATPDRIIIRDAGGRASVADPASGLHIANQQYVISRTPASVRLLFTASTNYIVPSGVTRLTVGVRGPGGNGGSGVCELNEFTTASGGSGGRGGAGFGYLWCQPGDTIAITINSSITTARNQRTGAALHGGRGGDGGNAVENPDPPGGVTGGSEGAPGTVSTSGTDVLLLIDQDVGNALPGGVGGAGESRVIGPGETCDIDTPAGLGTTGSVLITFP